MQQSLKVRDVHDAVAAKGLHRIIGQLAFAQVGADDATLVVGRDPAVGERAALDATHHRAVGVLLAHRPGDDFLIVHRHISEDSLG